MAWEYVRSWWISGSDERLAAAEAAMLRSIRNEVTTEEVPAGAAYHTIHTVRVKGTSLTAGQPLCGVPIVCLHGYGMGAASWSGSLSALASTGAEVFSIDWPGSGRSSRPQFPLGQGVDACEAFFVEALEAWRKSLGIERMVLLGHSFGGYFSACYAIKYPEHVAGLILASPVGMGEKREDSPTTDPPLQRRLFRAAVQSFWGGDWTPQAMIRVLGPLGRRPVDYYWNNRFQRSTGARAADTNFDAEREYMYQLAAQPACAEYCLGALLNFDFGVWAKRPIAQRLLDSFKARGTGAPPTALLYGEHDWMDSGRGVELARGLGGATAVFSVDGAGHQLFIENRAAFDAAALRALATVGFPGADAAARAAVATATGPLPGECNALPESVPGLYRRL